MTEARAGRAVERPLADADTLLSAARRPLILGIGGGGDVVGALATTSAGSRSSIGIEAPSGVAGSIVDSGAAT